jgi:hypothetical protein
MKQLLAWTGSVDSTITGKAVMAMAEKIQHWIGGLLADPQRAWSYASQRGYLWVCREHVQQPTDQDAPKRTNKGARAP